MAIPILNHLDLRSVSELRNALLHKTTESSASNVEGKIIYDTGTDTLKYRNASTWISLVGDTNTWRPVTAGGNSLSTSETLAFTAGTNVTITESAGAVTINSTYTDTNTNQLTTFTIRDDDDDAKVVAQNKFIKFISATGTAGTDWSGAGTTGDPWIMTITSPDTTTNTQNTYTSSWVDSSADVLLRLTAGGAGSGTQDIKLVAGTNIALTPSGANMTIDATDTNTWRTVTAGGNTLSTSEALDFVAGANITITESGGDVTIASTDTNTDTLQTTANVTSDTTQYVDFVASATGAQTAGTNAAFTFDPDTGTLRTTNIIVSGDSTIANETVKVVEDNTLQFEGASGSHIDHELNLTTAVLSADRTITLPDATGTIALTSGFSGTNTGDEPDASLTVKGIVELATIAETNTGSDAGRAVTPDGLDGWTGSIQVTTLGTIAIGTWEGDTVAINQGGTGATSASAAFTALKQAATASATGVVELATCLEVQTGTDTSRAVTPDTLACKTVTAIIATASVHATGLSAVINHGLDTKNLIVDAQLKNEDGTTDYGNCVIDWECTTDGSTDSDNHIYVKFAAAPPSDVTVNITSIKGATAITPTYPTS